MIQIGIKTLDSATPFIVGNWADPIPSDNPPYVNIPSTDGSGNVLTIDGAGVQTAEPLTHPDPPGKTQYIQVAAPAKGAGLISVQIGGAKLYFCIAGLQ